MTPVSPQSKENTMSVLETFFRLRFAEIGERQVRIAVEEMDTSNLATQQDLQAVQDRLE